MQSSSVSESVPTTRCVVDPAPAQWSQVPPIDIVPLNRVVQFWKNTFGDVLNVDLEVQRDRPYCWLIYLMPSAQPGAANLSRLKELDRVVDANYDTNASYHEYHGAVRIYVSRNDQLHSNVQNAAGEPASGELATDHFFRTNRAQAAALAAAFK